MDLRDGEETVRLKCHMVTIRADPESVLAYGNSATFGVTRG
jgi:hypothetical protein